MRITPDKSICAPSAVIATRSGAFVSRDLAECLVPPEDASATSPCAAGLAAGRGLAGRSVGVVVPLKEFGYFQQFRIHPEFRTLV